MCFAGLAWLSLFIAAHAQPRLSDIRVPAQTLSRALIELARQTRLTIGFTGIDFGDRLSNHVDGRFSPADALRRMLAGTGFDFDFLDENTVRVRVQMARGEAPPLRRPVPEEILITGTRLGDDALGLTNSASAVSGARLDEMRSRNLAEIARGVAGLSTTNLGTGQDKLFLRGLSDGAFAGHSQAMIAVYLDEALVADYSPEPALRLVDIARVEVLRGPHGTVHGAGSLGGLLRIVTNKPAYGEFAQTASVSGRTAERGRAGAGLNAMLNIPLAGDVLALRAVGYREQEDGYIDDVRLNARNVNETRTNGVRAALAWRPGDGWNIVSGVTYQEILAADSQYHQESLGLLRRANFLKEPRDDRFVHVHMTLAAGAEPTRLISTSAFARRRIDARLDASLAWPDLTGFPIGPSPFDSDRVIVSYTHETRLAGKISDSWQWLVGVFLAQRTDNYRSILAGPDGSGGYLRAVATDRDDKINELSLFSESTFRIVDGVSVTAGVRFHGYAVTADEILFRRSAGSDSVSEGKAKQLGVDPKLALTYSPQTNLTFYAQVAQASRRGGINIHGPAGAAGDEVGLDPKAFDTDQLWNYESGAKMNFLGGRGAANLATYYVAWKDIQTDQILPDGRYFVATAGTVRTFGVEADLALQVTETFQVRGTFSWTSATLDDSNSLLTRSRGLLPVVPDLTYGFSVRYDVPLEQGLGAFATFDYSFVGESRIGFDDDFSSAMGNYAIANLRLGIGREPWRIMIFADNLMDHRGTIFAFGNPFSADKIGQIISPRPRTLGVELSWTN